MYDVILSQMARDFYSVAEKSLAKKLAKAFAILEHTPRRHNNIKLLSGDFRGVFRFRAGDWRILYQILEARKQVQILAIAHRSEVYE
jgi:mRNA interferase RelE/StbE